MEEDYENAMKVLMTMRDYRDGLITREDVLSELKKYEDLEYLLTQEPLFLQRCSECGKFFREGYMLSDDRACSEKCRRALMSELDYLACYYGMYSLDDLFYRLKTGGFLIEKEALERVYKDRSLNVENSELVKSISSWLHLHCEEDPDSEYFYTEWDPTVMMPRDLKFQLEDDLIDFVNKHITELGL